MINGIEWVVYLSLCFQRVKGVEANESHLLQVSCTNARPNVSCVARMNGTGYSTMLNVG